jgi:hypothetical protein
VVGWGWGWGGDRAPPVGWQMSIPVPLSAIYNRGPANDGPKKLQIIVRGKNTHTAFCPATQHNYSGGEKGIRLLTMEKNSWYVEAAAYGPPACDKTCSRLGHLA